MNDELTPGPESPEDPAPHPSPGRSRDEVVRAMSAKGGGGASATVAAIFALLFIIALANTQAAMAELAAVMFTVLAITSIFQQRGDHPRWKATVVLAALLIGVQGPILDAVSLSTPSGGTVESSFTPAHALGQQSTFTFKVHNTGGHFLHLRIHFDTGDNWLDHNALGTGCDQVEATVVECGGSIDPGVTRTVKLTGLARRIGRYSFAPTFSQRVGLLSVREVALVNISDRTAFREAVARTVKPQPSPQPSTAPSPKAKPNPSPSPSPSPSPEPSAVAKLDVKIEFRTPVAMGSDSSLLIVAKNLGPPIESVSLIPYVTGAKWFDNNVWIDTTECQGSIQTKSLDCGKPSGDLIATGETVQLTVAASAKKPGNFEYHFLVAADGLDLLIPGTHQDQELVVTQAVLPS